MTENEVLRVEENGIEFFTIVATGESAVSERGLARMCGVSRSSIRNILNLTGTKNTTKMLGNLTEQDFYLVHKVTTKGGEIKAIKASVASRIILYYVGKGNAIAQASADAILEIGLTSYIHTKTGWLPGHFTAAPKAHADVSRILDKPNPWERLYDPALCRQAFAWFGADFYWKYCYQWMTPEERCKVDRLNPAIGGKRTHKIHQYLEEETRQRLTPKVIELRTLLSTSHSKRDFIDRYQDLYGRARQLELFK